MKHRASTAANGYVVAAKVVTGELGARLGLADADLARVVRILAAGAHGWRAFECETLDADGTYVGTVRLTTHPAAGPAGAAPMIVPVTSDDESAPDTAQRRARPKRTPAQRRVQAALASAESDRERQNGNPKRLSGTPPQPVPEDPSRV